MTTTYLNPANAAYIDQLLHQFEANPSTLDPTWQSFFEGVAFANGHAVTAPSSDQLAFELKVLHLIQAYREMGHLIADVNPLDRRQKSHPLLELSRFGLTSDDLQRTSLASRLAGRETEGTLADIIAALTTAYCGPATVEYGHIDDSAARQWIQARVESLALLAPLDTAWKTRVLEKLTQAEALDTFLHKRFVGQKRFSGEGNDVCIPMLDALIDVAAERGADEIVVGTAHRGRLNILVNVLGKEVKLIFAEFLGNLETDAQPGDGDVKYHLGFSGDVTTAAGKRVHASLVPNPSHLEAVNPVVMGIVRAKQKLKKDHEHRRTIAVLLHGDASFAGQGSIYELLNMSELAGYTVGGTIHIIINNQIGFTTTPTDGRSTPNATDIAKMLEAPILRVNADEPEAAIAAVRLALDYRTTFGRDVFIDLIGYRRYGHNEGDEPAFTQPLLYQQIADHRRVREQYAARLAADGVVAAARSDTWLTEMRERYDALLAETRQTKLARDLPAFQGTWSRFRAAGSAELFNPVRTTITQQAITTIGTQLITPPKNFHLHPKIERLLKDREAMLTGKRGIDFAVAEALAFASLLQEGYRIRLAGQDAERGTFSHRHAAFYDVETGTRFAPLDQFATGDVTFEVINSFLSELAALGFEFGQSLADPQKLTLWEAQFGDFANGGQMIIDQFVVSSALKWQRYSGLVMLLPHGYEGQGPEHSSARLERYLQACAQHNIQVGNLTTPAQYFHCLRRQMLRPVRIPLILMTPKSGLRHPRATSPLAEFARGNFHEVIDDDAKELKKSASRIVLCSGKIYYELLQGREAAKKEIPLIRVEQFYPFPGDQLAAIIALYKKVEEIVWCQEEPENMGAWHFMQRRLSPSLKPTQRFLYAGRPSQASPSGGYLHVHEAEQRQIVADAIGTHGESRG